MRVMGWGLDALHFLKLLQDHLSDQSAIQFGWYGDVDDLRKAVAFHRAEMPLVVLAPGSRAEVLILESLKPLLRDLPLIFLLPSEQKDFLAQIHGFHPRFISDGSLASENALTVAVHMLNNQGNRE